MDGMATACLRAGVRYTALLPTGWTVSASWDYLSMSILFGRYSIDPLMLGAVDSEQFGAGAS